MSDFLSYQTYKNMEIFRQELTQIWSEVLHKLSGKKELFFSHSGTGKKKIQMSNKDVSCIDTTSK